MEQENLKPIKIKSSDIQKIYDGGKVKGYEGYSIECDEDSGEYDAEKGSMTDYSICLYDKEGNFVGEASGGYYNGMCGHQFNYDLTFYPPEPETPLSRLNVFLDNLVHENLDLENKVTKIKKYLEELEA